ncbi:hypothetical protein EYF80_067961 [Liparis tanakae]|uniref:Uncharacterized protein n=1 Tax=Liparis tanakae TaxID=230148 RepID=A0A4Z2DZR2_9TELE|nr:hypothetical protein EYF80_067961 [Liparis tanakae]
MAFYRRSLRSTTTEAMNPNAAAPPGEDGCSLPRPNRTASALPFGIVSLRPNPAVRHVSFYSDSMRLAARPGRRLSTARRHGEGLGSQKRLRRPQRESLLRLSLLSETVNKRSLQIAGEPSGTGDSHM